MDIDIFINMFANLHKYASYYLEYTMNYFGYFYVPQVPVDCLPRELQTEDDMIIGLHYYQVEIKDRVEFHKHTTNLRRHFGAVLNREDADRLVAKGF